MDQINEVWNTFNKKDNNYTCKLCNKEFIIDESSSGQYTFEQRSFLILAQHLHKEH